MFAALPASILSRADLNDNAKIVYAALSMRLGGKARCWPSQAQLAEDTARDIRTIGRGIKALVEAGLIEVRKRKQGSAIYTVIVPEQRVSLDRTDLSGQEIKTGQICPQDQTDLSEGIEKEYKTTPPTPPHANSEVVERLGADAPPPQPPAKIHPVAARVKKREPHFFDEILLCWAEGIGQHTQAPVPWDQFLPLLQKHLTARPIVDVLHECMDCEPVRKPWRYFKKVYEEQQAKAAKRGPTVEETLARFRAEHAKSIR